MLVPLVGSCCMLYEGWVACALSRLPACLGVLCCLQSLLSSTARACRDRREKERAQLADLVGKNLTYISQLEGLDYALYLVRPRLLPVCNCLLAFAAA